MNGWKSVAKYENLSMNSLILIATFATVGAQTCSGASGTIRATFTNCIRDALVNVDGQVLFGLILGGSNGCHPSLRIDSE
jgi:hypothetical protein